jgi:deoxycytidine triphosphate deaminase
MILGPQKLLELVKKEKLVENLSQRELTNPEGAGFDLRLGEVHQIVSGSEAFLRETERQTPEIETLVSYEKGRKNVFIFEPRKYYLVSTIESVNTPTDITINFKPRTTTFRSGLVMRTGNVSPGYCGKLTFGLINLGPVPVKIEMGARIVHAQFYWVDGGGNKYRGQWQGGRVTTGKKREVQV